MPLMPPLLSDLSDCKTDSTTCPVGRRWVQIALGSVLALMLVSAGGCRSSAYYEGSSKRTTGEITDDVRIQSRVKTRLISHGETRGWRIDVDVFKGVVQLAGYVRSDAERQTAGDIARTTKGVQGVDNRLVVKTKTPKDEPQQTQEVDAAQ